MCEVIIGILAAILLVMAMVVHHLLTTRDQDLEYTRSLENRLYKTQ